MYETKNEERKFLFEAIAELAPKLCDYLAGKIIQNLSIAMGGSSEDGGDDNRRESAGFAEELKKHMTDEDFQRLAKEVDPSLLTFSEYEAL